MENANHELRTENKKLAPALPNGSGGGPETLMSQHDLHHEHPSNPKYGARAHPEPPKHISLSISL